ncbi:MAG TPA: hypothetical protein ENI85_03895, partial [Deltaproteobacteria bacterium]|nr:hypothetical protein [Deltaproteobacteria bacterium]
MKPLRLYTAFHGNLDFSALPDADRPVVIARCYWPLLRLPEELGIPIGFEMSARTLRSLQEEDPEWVKRFRGLSERGLVEPIGSGWAQVVAPLAPAEINRANLELGIDLYREILGFVPETFLVHEQTWSDGLTDLHREAGCCRIVMEWNNPASRQPALRPLRCQPSRLGSPESPGPLLLWNDSIVFQKMQRIAHGEIPRAELDRLLGRLSADGGEALCIYGGDVEIFDYRPSRPVPGQDGSGPGMEMERLIGTFEALAGDSRFEFALPRDVVCGNDCLPFVELGCAEEPIPCKKQPRYNPTRWAVSGRDGFGMNTRCHSLLRLDRAARRLAGGGREAGCPVELVDLWRSDFRTRATEEKVVEFESRVGLAGQEARARLDRVMPRLEDDEDLLIVNPGSNAWSGLPVEIPLRLPSGRFRNLSLQTRRGERLDRDDYQIEISGRHRDGSIRQAVLVLEPRIASGRELSLAFVPIDAVPDGGGEDRSPGSAITERVEADFLRHRGAAIERLRFPSISQRAVLGTIPHGSFDEIEFTPDFYSGHVVAVAEAGSKETDLGPVGLECDPTASGAVRITVEAVLHSRHGAWRKIYRLYRHHARLEVVHDLALHDARLASLRLGMFTLLPDGWNREGLRYGTLNGGPRAEWRQLAAGT